jgi:hypothetical protein
VCCEVVHELLLEVLATIRREPNVWLDETAKI